MLLVKSYIETYCNASKSAPDEIDAHTTMFYTSSATYYQMGLRAAALISHCVENEDKYGDQIQTQSDGDKEHGQSSQEAYGVDEETVEQLL